jgi:hypothetical protein
MRENEKGRGPYREELERLLRELFPTGADAGETRVVLVIWKNVVALGAPPRACAVMVRQRYLEARRRPAEEGRLPRNGFPRWWRLFSFILPRDFRLRVFEPLFQELLEDYAEARSCRTKWGCRWLALCFSWKTVRMVLSCLHEMVKDRTVAWLLRWIPEPLKKWRKAE